MNQRNRESKYPHQGYQTEWLMMPACPSLMHSLNAGNVEGTDSSKTDVWCLFMDFCFMFAKWLVFWSDYGDMPGCSTRMPWRHWIGRVENWNFPRQAGWSRLVSPHWLQLPNKKSVLTMNQRNRESKYPHQGYQTEWLMMPACPSLCSLNAGNIEGTDSSETDIWCLYRDFCWSGYIYYFKKQC